MAVAGVPEACDYDSERSGLWISGVDPDFHGNLRGESEGRSGLEGNREEGKGEVGWQKKRYVC